VSSIVTPQICCLLDAYPSLHLQVEVSPLQETVLIFPRSGDDAASTASCETELRHYAPINQVRCVSLFGSAHDPLLAHTFTMSSAGLILLLCCQESLLLDEITNTLPSSGPK
jgi:hypothetical protein